MIVRATLRDWDKFRSLSEDFNKAYYDVPLDTQKLWTWFEHHLDHGVIYLSETGYICGLPISDPVRDWDAIVETAWYDPGTAGTHLLRKLIRYARDEGCDELRMTTLNTTPVGVRTLLERIGFEEIERSHRLIL